MKKILLVFLLFFSTFSQSQILEITRNCETGFYDLAQAAELHGAPMYSYVFFTTLSDAQNNVSPILNLTNYLPADGQEFIYAQEYNGYSDTTSIKAIPLREYFTTLLILSTDFPSSQASVDVWSGVPPFTYRWFVEGVELLGENESGLNLSTYNFPEVIQCIVTDSNGCESAAGAIDGIGYTAAMPDILEITLGADFLPISDKSVLANDVFQSYPFVAVANTEIVAIPIGEDWNNFTLGADGKITAAPNTPLGLYNLQYQMVESPNMTVLSTAIVSLRVAKAALKLTSFYDLNTDGIKQENEPFVDSGFYHNIPQTPQFNWPIKPNGSTYYSIISDGEPLSIQVTSINGTTNFQNVTCNTYFENIPITLSTPMQELLFPFIAAQTDDLSVNTGIIAASPGFTRPFLVTVSNPTNQAAGPFTVTFTKPTQSEIVQFPAGTTPTETGFTITIDSIEALSNLLFSGSIQFDVIPNVSLNEPISMSATIVYGADPNLLNNTSTFNAVFMGSYDPNDIMEARGPEIRISDFSENDYLTYTIRFENTGNAAAENIRIVNELPSGLDTSTVQVLGASHPFQKSFFNGVLTVRMDNIELPPSNGSATIGNGFITYRVKPTAGFTVGTQIENTAEIYFDFNPAIVTPTWTTTFVEQLSVEESQPFVQFYTNPVSDLFELTLVDNQANAFATVYDLKGSVLAKVETVNGKLQIETQNWMSGIYVLQLQSGEKIEHLKLLKR